MNIKKNRMYAFILKKNTIYMLSICTYMCWAMESTYVAKENEKRCHFKKE